MKTAIKQNNEAINNEIAIIQGRISANVPIVYKGLTLTIEGARKKIQELKNQINK